ncbi:MAG: hypothetical protein WBB01_14195 [Phormidesmis sp.]
MHVATSLTDEQATKLTYIQQQTNQNVAEIVSQAIELYYEKIKPTENLKSASEDQGHSSSGKNLLKVFQESGLVGCIKDGDPDLSTNYKSIISQELEEKYEREQQYEPEQL